jgi:lipid-A-disaccharide synthase
LSLVAEKIRNQIQDVRIVIGCLHERHAAFTAEHCRQADVRIYSGKTQELMLIADACVACSGSVSLELLYHRLPTVVVYKVSLAKMLIQAFVLRCKYISLPNLMQTDDIRKTSWRPYDPDKLGSDELLMPEYLTHRDVSAKVASRVLRWLESDAERMRKKQELNSLAVRVAIGGASQRAADIIINRLSPRRRVSGNPAA